MLLPIQPTIIKINSQQLQTTCEWTECFYWTSHKPTLFASIRPCRDHHHPLFAHHCWKLHITCTNKLTKHAWTQTPNTSTLNGKLHLRKELKQWVKTIAKATYLYIYNVAQSYIYVHYTVIIRYAWLLKPCDFGRRFVKHLWRMKQRNRSHLNLTNQTNPRFRCFLISLSSSHQTNV